MLRRRSQELGAPGIIQLVYFPPALSPYRVVIQYSQHKNMLLFIYIHSYSKSLFVAALSVFYIMMAEFSSKAQISVFYIHRT